MGTTSLPVTLLDRWVRSAEASIVEVGSVVDFTSEIESRCTSLFQRTDRMLDSLEQVLAELQQWVEIVTLDDTTVQRLFSAVNHSMASLLECREKFRHESTSNANRSIRKSTHRVIYDLNSRIERLAGLMRTMAVFWGTADVSHSDDIAREVWTIRIPWRGYLRAMLNLLWSAVRHPLSETTIDLSTGRVLYRS